MMLKQVFALVSVAYVLFQKKLLPRPLTRLAARFYFWPTIPITISRLRMVPPHEYWSDVDATLLVGGAPLPEPSPDEARPMPTTSSVAFTTAARWITGVSMVLKLKAQARPWR